MPYNGDAIAAEIKSALEEAAIATGRNAPLTGTLLKDTPANLDVYPPVMGGETSYPITCLLTQYSPTQIDGVGILSTDIRVLVAAHGLAVAPSTNDRLNIEGEIFYIANSPSLRPGGVALMYDIQARKR